MGTRAAFEATYLRELRRFLRAVPSARPVPMAWTDARCPDPDGGCAPRDYACTHYRGKRPVVVVFARRVLRLSRSHWLGLIRHELGHVVDPRWSAPGAERRADRIAQRVTGVPIRYDRRDVQTVGRGIAPRPAHLPA